MILFIDIGICGQRSNFLGLSLLHALFPQPFIMDKPPKGKFYATFTLSVEIYMDLFIV